MLRAIFFASCYVYSPCGRGAASQRSRMRCGLLKSGNSRFIAAVAARIAQQSRTRATLQDFFCHSDVLVPVPGSEAGLSSPGTATAALCAALRSEGIGGRVWAGLNRTYTVRKSSTSPHGLRPTVRDHFDSFAMSPWPDWPTPGRIILIDDVVTKGRTLMAAALRIHASLPEVRIRAFAVLRTLGVVPDVHQLLDPCVGKIVMRGNDVRRAP